MRIYSTLQIGEYHLNHCEDYLFADTYDTHKTICCVMDGCTMGIDSHFASTLVGKLIRKVAKKVSYERLFDPGSRTQSLEEDLKQILHGLFFELQAAKSLLLLEHTELLTTLTVLLLDKRQNQGLLLVIGDGLVCINGKVIDFDQNNKPDYLGFHLAEDFGDWYSKQGQKISFSAIDDVSIATDGIVSFAKVHSIESAGEIDPVAYLLIDTEGKESEEMLNRKLKVIEHKYGLKPTDDLAIIRAVSDAS